MGDGVHRLPDGHGKLDRHGRVQAGCAAVLEDVLEMWTEKWFFNYIDARNLKQRYPLCECGAKIIGVEERFEFE